MIAPIRNITKRLHIVQPYNSIAMQRMTYPLTTELSKLYEVTTSEQVDTAADLNIHAPWHSMVGLETKGDGKHLIMYTHCNAGAAPLLLDACERADIVTAMSFEGRRELVTLGVDPKKIWVIYCGAEQFIYRKRLIGIVGYPQPNGRKREHLLLDLAWKYDLSPFQFLFVGDDTGHTAAQLKSLGVSADAILADDKALADIYGRLDALLVTGYSEGGPLPLLEAMASGTRVLSPRFGYAADLLTADSFYESADELMEKLDELAQPSLDNALLARAWSWTDYTAEYALLIGRLLGESVDLYPERGASRYAQLLDVIDEVKPQNIVEIGTWRGDRALQMIQAAAKYRPIETVWYQGFDLFEGMTGEQFRREFSKHGCPEEIVYRRLEATRATVDLVAGETKDTLYDALILDDMSECDQLYFVDGGHSEETIEHDSRVVLEAMRCLDNSVAVFDDYYHENKPDGMGCNKVIDALPFDEYQVTHLPARTKTQDGLEIGMVKVKRYARIHLQMPQTTYSTSYFVDVTGYRGLPN
jgi:hypothetical protein